MFVLNFSATQQFDYHWQPLSQARMGGIPKHLRYWLAEPGSLTARLKSMGSLSIDVIKDTWGQPTHREQISLGLRPREAARVREVILKVNGTAVIYARSIVPARALVGHWRHLSQLKNQPLGGYLFKNKNLLRSPIEIALLPVNCFHNINEIVWARRSVFKQYNKGVLVCEAFLPAIKTLPATHLLP
ncbi:chorismate lyase [Marinomonas sp. 15G1-11]|uniref:Probable chorismate pyruvate-lyase n=1 Tax=Marinomonas phaeophyticola TaxID=3004091 RepID=A0ABT4JWC7_9GAMM|nr:chorismate lyase [Marinomonas sp. 15G1-11]MCZ2722678.1 chorismate lyase [Marinomonas sp. 15G1-11]